MITSILLIIIGVKLDILNGWYLGLIIAQIAIEIIKLCVACVKAGADS